MPVSKIVNTYIDTVKPLAQWRPNVGDWIYYSGWVRHWIGLVVEKTSDDQQLKVVKSTLHSRIFTMGPKEQNENMIVLDVSEIKGTRCTYTVDQVAGGRRMWYA